MELTFSGKVMFSFFFDFFFPKKKKKQPHPKVNRADVERVVRRDFPPEQFDSVLALLDEYGVKDFQSEKDRVQLAVLKLAGGSIEKLLQTIEVAMIDYRDVLAPAEYPKYQAEVSPTEKLPVKKYNRIIESDWQQYQDWLLR
jgi:hypothetical protein